MTHITSAPEAPNNTAVVTVTATQPAPAYGATGGAVSAVPLLTGSFCRDESFAPAKAFPLAGIPVSYAGQLAYSDEDGIFSFTLQHPDSTLRIIIGSTFTPVLAQGETVSYLAIPATASAAIYTIQLVEEQQDGKETPATPSDTIKSTTPRSRFVWKTKLEQRPAQEQTKTHLNDLLIFAEPAAVFVNTQDIKTTYTQRPAQFIIPSGLLYVAAPITSDALALSKYFSLVEKTKEVRIEAPAPKEGQADVTANAVTQTQLLKK